MATVPLTPIDVAPGAVSTNSLTGSLSTSNTYTFPNNGKCLVQFRTHRAPTISRRETMTFMRDDRHVERTQRSDEMGTIPTAMSL